MILFPSSTGLMRLSVCVCVCVCVCLYVGVILSERLYFQALGTQLFPEQSEAIPLPSSLGLIGAHVHVCVCVCVCVCVAVFVCVSVCHSQ